MNNNNNNSAQAQAVKAPLGNKTAKTLAFIGMATLETMKIVSTVLKITTATVEATENVVILGAKKATKVTKLNTTRAGKEFGKGFVAQEAESRELTAIINDLANFETKSYKAYTAKKAK